MSKLPWRVAITARETEFQVADALRQQGLDVFLPYVRGKVRVKLPTRGRALFKAETRDVPRWPRYLFTDIENVGNLLKIRHVRGVISFGGEVAAVPDHIVDALRKGCDITGRVIKHSYLVGDILRFVEPSPLVGRKGVVLRLDDAAMVMSVGHLTVATPYAEVAPIA